ncbi:hypothetical protein G6F68_010866 [Rhizopus microsporus]|nr:hypothetical protein G6F68_010866 [Rhizopus microsporus]
MRLASSPRGRSGRPGPPGSAAERAGPPARRAGLHREALPGLGPAFLAAVRQRWGRRRSAGGNPAGPPPDRPTGA